MNYNKLLNNVSGLQVFQLLRFGSFFLSGILLAKGPVSIETIGVYESLMFLSGALSFFWVNALLNSLLAAYPSHTEKRKYLFNVAVLITVFSVGIFMVMRLAEPLIVNYFSKSTLPYFHLFSYFILLNNPCFLIEYIYLIHQKPKQLLQYGLISFTLAIAAVILPLYLGYDLEVSVQCLIVLAVIKLLWLIKLLLQYTELKFESHHIKQHFYLAFPLLLSFLMSGSADYIDGLMVSHFFGAKMFAIFRYGAKEFPLSLLLANALSTALIPTLSGSNQLEEGMTTLKEKSKRLMHFLFPISIVLVLTSKWFYPLVFNQNFVGSVPIFNIYLLLVICRLVFPQTLVMALQKTKTIFFISIIEIAVNVVASYLLMLRFGVIGIAYGTVIAFFTEKILLMCYLFYKKDIAPGKYIPIRNWIVYGIVLIVCYGISLVN